MAIDYSEFFYTNSDKEGKNLESGLKANKSFDKFLYQFRVEGRLHRKVLTYLTTQHKKTDRIKKANSEALAYLKKKEDELSNDDDFTLDTKFTYLAEEYLRLKSKAKRLKKKKKEERTILLNSNHWIADTKWTEEKITMLEHYIYPFLKNKKANAIRERDILKIKLSMETSGYGKQNKDGCSDRTIRKVLLQVLKPILEYGERNGAMRKVPKITVPSKTKKKKVKDGTSKLTTLYGAINTLYQDDPFYRALFLFAFFGRRWNEIRTLEWTDVNFEKMEYTIRKENSKIDEDKTFSLPQDISETLSSFKDSTGLVFKSPKTGKELSTPKRQLERLKTASGIEELTLHYFRHIAATALGEVGMVNTVLSAALGHNNAQTVDNYYRTANHLKGSQKATQAIEHIVEVGDE